MKVLLTSGSNVNLYLNELCLTPLIFATQQKNLEMMKCLVDNKADINFQTEESMSPLHEACAGDFTEGHSAFFLGFLFTSSDLSFPKFLEFPGIGKFPGILHNSREFPEIKQMVLLNFQSPLFEPFFRPRTIDFSCITQKLLVLQSKQAQF